MTNEDYYRKKLAYEKALEIRYRQVELGYQVVNFFLAGMSFLVLAFATILASGSAIELHAASRGIAFLGIALSAIFAIVGFLATQTIRRYDDYLLKTESGAELANGPFETILSDASHVPFSREPKKGAAGHIRKLAMSWCIPTVFICFWVSMLAIFWN